MRGAVLSLTRPHDRSLRGPLPHLDDGSPIAPYDTWGGNKAGGSVEKLGLKRVREILGGKSKETITALIAKDKAEEGNAKSIGGLNMLGLSTGVISSRGRR